MCDGRKVITLNHAVQLERTFRLLVTGRFLTAINLDLAYRLSSLLLDNRAARYKKGLLYEKQTSKGFRQRSLHPAGRSQKKAERNDGRNGQKAGTQERCAINRQWQTRFKVAALSQESLLQASSMNEDTVDEITGLADTLGRLLDAMNAQVTTAESCTGGGIAEAITRIAGSSAWFEAGYVTYSNAQKTRQLGVPEALFVEAGAVSQPVVEAMVRGAQRESGARFAVAVSGVAGPGGGSPDKPVGTVWLCWGKDNALVAQRRQFDGDRDQVRRQTVEAALQGLIQLACGEMPKQG